MNWSDDDWYIWQQYSVQEVSIKQARRWLQWQLYVIQTYMAGPHPDYSLLLTEIKTLAFYSEELNIIDACIQRSKYKVSMENWMQITALQGNGKYRFCAETASSYYRIDIADA